MLKILSMTTMILSFLMIFLKTPLSMGFIILLQTILMCLISGMINKTYWFSYILFITFLGGLLVLFIYIASIASNNMYKLSFNMYMYMLILIFLFMVSTYCLNSLNWMNFNINNSEMNDKLNLFMFFNNENKINLNKMYNNHSFMMMLLLIIYLFISLICVIKITNIFYGPLRSNN